VDRPGPTQPRAADAAPAAILTELADEFTPDQVAWLDSKLNVLQDTYSEAELDAVSQQILPLTQPKGGNVSNGIGCFQAGSWRVDVTRFGVERTPDVIAETEALLAPFGDKVTLNIPLACRCRLPGPLSLRRPRRRRPHRPPNS
jgi:hypothetical protein